MLASAGLKIAPSGYYAAKTRPPSVRALRDAQVTPRLRALWEANYRAYGARKLWKAAHRAGIDIGRDQVARLMRRACIEGVRRGRRIRTTRPEMAAARHPDLVERDFTADAPNQLWVTDLTFVPTWAGVAYVCFIVDAYSRMIVGWRVAGHMRTTMVLDAIEMARWQRGAHIPGLRCHSDAGSQGGFNWSSQHLEMEVLDGSPSAGSRSCAAAKVEVSGSVGLSAACRGCVLASHRGGEADRGCGRGGRRVGSHRWQMVPSRWRHAANESGRAVGPVPVVLGA